MKRVIYKSFDKIELPELGLGALRLPTTTNKFGDPINQAEAQKMIDYSMSNGVNYFDTAYAYGIDCDNEKSLSAMLSKYPRNSYYLATKYLNFTGDNYDELLKKQFERFNTDYFDFYMIHSVFDSTYQKYLDNGSIEYLAEQKRKGRIKYLGFSSHASIDTLKALADYYPWDFAQIQLNYFDWFYGRAKEEYNFLVERGLPIIVMEPVRGGRLASLSEQAESVLKAARPNRSIVSWAFRWLRSFPGVQMTLSGMSTMEQLKENIKLFSETNKDFTDDDEKYLYEACEIFRSGIGVPCTNCLYCVNECPVGIDIPRVMNIYNNVTQDEGAWEFNGILDLDPEKTPANCIKCNVCENRCPQQVEILNIMGEITDWQQKKSGDRWA